MEWEDVLKEMGELDKQERQGMATIQDARPLTEDELYEMENDARERDWHNEHDGILSPMGAEIVLRKIKVCSIGEIQSVLDEYFPSCDKIKAAEIVDEMETYNEDWEEEQGKPHLKPKRLGRLKEWAKSKPTKAVRASEKGFVFTGLKGRFADEKFKSYMAAGVKYGYLNNDYSVKSENPTQFFPFVYKLGDLYGYGYKKAAGEQWYGDRKVFDKVKRKDRKDFNRLVDELDKEIKCKEICKLTQNG